MDDALVIIKSSLKQLFTDYLNTQYPSITFTIEDQVDRKLVMLENPGLGITRKQTVLLYLPQTHSHRPLSEICIPPTIRTKTLYLL